MSRKSQISSLNEEIERQYIMLYTAQARKDWDEANSIQQYITTLERREALLEKRQASVAED